MSIADELTDGGYKPPIPPGGITITPRDIQIGGDHYKNRRFQVWDIVEEYELDFFLGNVVKYVLRHKNKGGLEDLKKARHYLDHKIHLMERGA